MSIASRLSLSDADATRSAAAHPGLERLRDGNPSHSIRLRLYSVFALLFLLVIGLGSFGFARLSEINHLSEVIREHWLRDTGILGDLSNYMSDYRTAEATRLLASTPAELASSERDLEKLHDTVASSERAYEALAQAPSELALYHDFAREWALYQTMARRVIALADEGSVPAATALFHDESRVPFDRSSDILARLTDATVLNARADSARAAATYARARIMILAAMMLAAVLLVGVIVYVTRGILAPLLRLADCMHRLARHDTHIEIEGAERDDEIGEMARAVAVFRNNALALVTSQRRLLEQAAALEEGLEHERRLTAQQRDFVSMTSHEFRTPLTVIDGHAQRLIKMSDRLDSADVAERGGRIRSAVQRITNIMDSLLGASRVLDGHAVFDPRELDPRTVLSDACQAHRDATRGALIVEKMTNLPERIRGDSKLLFHAFSNLISNAIKYSPPGSPVEVSAQADQGWLTVQVLDHGIGIPARDRERLFERYFRGSNATAIAGTGVGLHLVEMVVKLHRGEVFAESLEGVGSRFIVRLPLEDAEGRETAAA
jgi:signal transduction histidine kinase